MQTQVLVVGLGSIGQRHARILSERDDVSLSVCDAVDAYREQTLASLSRPGTAYADYSAALEQKPDIVFVCTPNHLHVPMSLQAVENGVDVFVEKPLAEDVPQARRLVAAADEAGRFLQVGYMLRYDDGLRWMHEKIEEGGIGNIIGGRAMVGSYVTLLNAKSPDRINTPYNLVVDYTHEIDMIRWFFGDVQAIQALGAAAGDIELKPTPNMFQMNLRMKGGALVQVHMDYIQFPQRRILEVYGDRGTLEYDMMAGAVKYFSYGREHCWETVDVGAMAQRWDGFFRIEHESILKNRNAGKPPLVSGHDGLAALEIAEKAIAAAKSGITEVMN